jgi:ABC-type sugar transport system ATPase subunit
MSTPLIAVTSVSKRFGGVLAVDNVSFAVFPGEVLALVGENGAGKSTTVGVISGDHRPDSGSVVFRGREIGGQSPKLIRSLGIETVYQDLALAENFGAGLNVFLGRELTRRAPFRTTDRKRMVNEAEQTLQALGFRLPARNRLVRTLSGGQRQGVAVARAVHWKPTVLIMDEPTAAVGVEGRRRIKELIADQRRQGCSILYVTPNVREAFDIADRILVMRKGRSVAEKLVRESSVEEVVAYIVGARKAGTTGV